MTHEGTREVRGIIKAFQRAFRPTVSDGRIRSSEAVGEDVARGVVRRTATGSVRLQRGQYVTRKDVDQKWEQVKDYRFDDLD